MNDEKNITAPAGAEPTVGSAGLPLWPVLLLGVLFFGSQLYVDGTSGGFRGDVYAESLKTPPPTGDLPPDVKLFIRGAEIYKACAACHQPNGLGTPGQFPPLAGSDWVLADGPNRIIRIVLDGLQGPIKVTSKGVPSDWSNVMVPWRDALPDSDIAAVITYIRRNSEWGHNASVVTPQQVKAVRDASSGHAGTPNSADELLKVSEQ